MNETASTKIHAEGLLDRAFASRLAKYLFFIISGLVLLSFITTRKFTQLDLNLYGYAVGTFVFIGGFLYRYLAWADRPPTKIFIKKGFRLLFNKSTPKTAVNHLVSYNFIYNRGWYRWTQHFLIGMGCILASLVTFPLVFGWMYFTMETNGYYSVVFLGINIMQIKSDGLMMLLFSNTLNLTSFMVIAGVSMAIYRRIKNMQARAEQTYFYDFLPLHLLLFISITGLALPFVNLFLAGAGHPTLSLIHEFSVIITLLYLPFGKLAHFPFRPVSVFAKNYREHYMEKDPFECKVCGETYVSTEQAEDVKQVLAVNNINFEMEEGFHLAEMCLPCKRKYRIARFSGTPTHLIEHKEANQDAKG